MTADDLHRRARALAAERRITVTDALAELGRRGAAKRARRNYGTVTIPRRAPADVRAVESPRYWWMDR